MQQQLSHVKKNLNQVGRAEMKRVICANKAYALQLLKTTTAAPMSETKKQKMTPENPRIIALFDVDGTLTIPRGGE